MCIHARLLNILYAGEIPISQTYILLIVFFLVFVVYLASRAHGSRLVLP